MTIERLTRGCILNPYTFLDGTVMTVKAVCVQTVGILVIDRTRFWKIIQNDAELCKKVRDSVEIHIQRLKMGNLDIKALKKPMYYGNGQ